MAIPSLLLSGGLHHPFEATSGALADIARQTGKFEVHITTDLADLNPDRLEKFDLFVLNACLPIGTYPPLTDAQKNALRQFVADGKGVFSVHSGSILFNDWDEFTGLIGGYWEDGVSAHGPYQPGYEIRVVDHAHPITEGVSDFEIHDELYHTLTMTAHVHLLTTAYWDRKLQPMGWTREVGGARIHYNALGHGVETYRCEPFLRLLERGLLWTGRVI